ncbi:hypothetical protein DFH09DRAFT_1212299 [Mycena vulgaris]|nr:hypothetical protein DFH09DRAFT_1212299 [Mycena vulgaris]
MCGSLLYLGCSELAGKELVFGVDRDSVEVPTIQFPFQTVHLEEELEDDGFRPFMPGVAKNIVSREILGVAVEDESCFVFLREPCRSRAAPKTKAGGVAPLRIFEGGCSLLHDIQSWREVDRIVIIGATSVNISQDTGDELAKLVRCFGYEVFAIITRGGCQPSQATLHSHRVPQLAAGGTEPAMVLAFDQALVDPRQIGREVVFQIGELGKKRREMRSRVRRRTLALRAILGNGGDQMLQEPVEGFG